MSPQDQTFEQLKLKYQSAINLMKQSGVRLSHVHLQNGRLFIQGEAPSDEVKNRAWDQIKLIDPSYPDLTADITVNASLAAVAGVPRAADMQTYTVKAGDTLSKISKQFYGDANKYMRIFEANRDQLTDPNKIQIGQQLRIPAAPVGVS